MMSDEYIRDIVITEIHDGEARIDFEPSHYSITRQEMEDFLLAQTAAGRMSASNMEYFEAGMITIYVNLARKINLDGITGRIRQKIEESEKDAYSATELRIVRPQPRPQLF